MAHTNPFLSDADLRDFLSLQHPTVKVATDGSPGLLQGVLNAGQGALKSVEGAGDAVGKTVGLDHLGSIAPNLIGGLAGATVGGGALAMASGRHSDETDAEFHDRRRRNALSGALAGGAVGLAAPSVAGALDGDKPGIGSRIMNYWNPSHNTLSGGVAGGAAGAVAGTAAAGGGGGLANKLLSSDGNKSPVFNDPLKDAINTNQSIKDNFPAQINDPANVGQKIVNPEFAAAEGRQARLLKLLDAKNNPAMRERTFGATAGGYAGEFKNLGVSRYGRLAKILAAGAGLGATAGAGLGAYNAMDSSN